MTKPYTQPGDNNGNCESCDKAGGGQSSVPVMLGGGMGLGKMWMCSRCIKEHGGLEKILEHAESERRKLLGGIESPISCCPTCQRPL